MKSPDHRDPHKVLDYIKKLENEVAQPGFEIDQRQDIQVKIRVNESIGPGMFKPDPLIPGGYLANSLTLRAMRPDIFVLGESTEDLAVLHECACGHQLDLQFWKLCPHCAREIKF